MIYYITLLFIIFIVLSIPDAYEKSKKDAKKINVLHNRSPKHLNNIIKNKINNKNK